ncbi:LA2681 family HEPN domain-containing protein [Geothrix paludis]|uniref:LA2681 family HEPN domain-containing protein n=1 Tax=Geothrix paludis TaxID=2922722 RepID=UPI001FAC1440|nr:LA2681 family HEPN domain-containing protein [Geothrix paludis]
MNQALSKLGESIDSATSEGNLDALNNCLAQAKSINVENLSKVQEATLNYFIANIHYAKRYIKNEHLSWGWNQINLEEEIYHLRVAHKLIINEPIKNIQTDLSFRISTNLANALNYVGRFVEAIELWDFTIKQNPKFAMAIGNRAQAYFYYARYIDSTELRNYMLKASFQDFKKALKIGVEDHARASMIQWVNKLSDIAIWDNIHPSLSIIKTTESDLEVEYRKWCSLNRLTLNSSNDISWAKQGFYDDLVLPAITLPLENSSPLLPSPYSIFNQLKQEYVSARYLIFEAIQDNKHDVHFSDRGVVLFDALDYRLYRFWVEKLKMAFLGAHAIFDKIAYLINEYWQLHLPPKRIDFYKIWNIKGKAELAEPFSSSTNWPLRGLYWLSKDLYYQSSPTRSINPDAKILHDIRNHIAHKYLKVHDQFFFYPNDNPDIHPNERSYPISSSQFVAQTINLLKLTRSALIYLAAAVKHEEHHKKRNSNRGLTLPMMINLVEDDLRL